MPEINEILAPKVGRVEESVTARDEDDQLIAREKATRKKFRQFVTIWLDGHEISVPKAIPATDVLGNEIREANGKTKPRSTTIYDAARQLVTQGIWSEDELARRIPLLCHREHLDPVAVCRMCSVHVCKYKKSQKRVAANPTLVPACQHEVQDQMQITTRLGQNEINKDSGKFAEKVQKSVEVLTQLLIADHRHPDPVRDSRFINELDVVALNLGVGPRESLSAGPERNVPRGLKSRPIPLDLTGDFPYSSRTITVDHNRCILCDRCVRSCADVKPFKIIGHTGKGYGTRISFDLDMIQNDSNCVQCGECMTACPTGALTLQRRVAPRAFSGAPPIPEDPETPLPAGAGFLTAEQMMDVEIEYADEHGETKQFAPFRSIPFAYLKWNEGAVRRRSVEAGEILCRYGDFGSTAFLLRSGSFELLKPESDTAGPEKGFFSRLLGKSGQGRRPAEKIFLTVDARVLILGELAALSNKPRTATIRAASEGEIYEVTRNLLDMAQRSPSGRQALGSVYTRNAVSTCLRGGKLFDGLNQFQRDAAESFLNTAIGPDKERAELRRVAPGEAIVVEGAPAADFWIIRSGFVKIVRTINGAEQAVARLPAVVDAGTPHEKRVDYFGDVALLAEHPRIAPLLKRSGIDARRRSASVIALDPVEVVRIPGKLFDDFCEAFAEVRENLVEQCVRNLEVNRQTRERDQDNLGDYLQQGIFQGQKMLVLDLESCTRCDECTRACADSHGDGVSRLLREGQRFGDYLVATSCRSCHKPYCMDGCPVDAIHRSPTSLEVRIDNHCIGCGLCETNCPYGAIQMVAKVAEESEKGMTAALAKRAVNCDLCHDLVPSGADPFCVAACPHEAAFRWDGETLLKKASL